MTAGLSPIVYALDALRGMAPSYYDFASLLAHNYVNLCSWPSIIQCNHKDFAVCLREVQDSV